MLSVIIPSYKDPYLQKTIFSILQNFQGEFEVIVVMDGYWAPVPNDKRVRVLHLGKNAGMRNAINSGVKLARGEYIMRTDEHCMFDPGFDVAMTKVCEPDTIYTARRYFLDPVKWERMDLPHWDYERLMVNDGKKFEGRHWRERERERSHLLQDETMAMQGSCWVMPKAWWEKVIGELDSEHYGPLIQDSHEMVFKTWKAGGRLMVNKETWFAHKHVSFPRTHNQGTPETPARNDEGYAYALQTWGDYYEKEIRPLWKI
jgi:hypothetical protein